MSVLCLMPVPSSPGPVRHAHPAAKCALPALGSAGYLALAHRQVSPFSLSWFRLTACRPGASSPHLGRADALAGWVWAARSRKEATLLCEHLGDALQVSGLQAPPRTVLPGQHWGSVASGLLTPLLVATASSSFLPVELHFCCEERPFRNPQGHMVCDPMANSGPTVCSSTGR